MPGQGTLVTVKGQAQGDAFKEPEFFNALLGIWLGPKPADQQLKKHCWERLAELLKLALAPASLGSNQAGQIGLHESVRCSTEGPVPCAA